jgi:hypothetical protein
MEKRRMKARAARVVRPGMGPSARRVRRVGISAGMEERRLDTVAVPV